MSEELVRQLAADLGATKLEFMPPLPDGTGGAVMSFPLRKDHWIYGDRSMERKVCDGPDGEIWHEPPPMPLRMGTGHRISYEIQDQEQVESGKLGYRRGIALSKEDFANIIKKAGRYAVRAATMKGREMDFDPDALIQNLQIGLLGYWSSDGLSSIDEWANPEGVAR